VIADKMGPEAWGEIIGLTLGMDYANGDDGIKTIANRLRLIRFDFYRMSGLMAADEEIDSNGHRRNTDVEVANKLIRWLGYKPSSVSRPGATGKRDRVYRVSNGDCPHRYALELGMEERYKGLLAKLGAGSLSPSDDFNSKFIKLESLDMITADPLDSRLVQDVAACIETGAKDRAVGLSEIVRRLAADFSIAIVRAAGELLPRWKRQVFVLLG
jgi:hypothetical protein